MSRLAPAILSVPLVLLAAKQTVAALVWESTFDNGTDGVVDVRDEDPTKAMIGANTGGRLTIVTAGRTVTQADKAGRALPSSVGANDSFSGYYKWNYSDYQDDGTNGVEEVAGFISGESPYCTRQFMGAAFIHYRDDNGDYHLRFGSRWGSEGNVGSGRNFAQTPGDLDFGSSAPIGKEFQLVVAYDGNTKFLTTTLYDGAGNQLDTTSADIRTFDNLGVAPDDPALQTEMAQLSLTSMGWEDFISGVTAEKTHTWSVDSIAYYDDATGAFSQVVVPEPASIAILSMGVGSLLIGSRRRRACNTAGSCR